MEKVLGKEDEEQLAADLEEQLVADLSQLSAWQEGSEGSMCSHHDPYADSCIGFGAQPALPMDQKERLMKRKVLRHRPDGRVEVSDESLNIKPCKNPWCTGHYRRFRDDTIYDEETASSSNLEGLLPYDDDDDWLHEDSPCSLLGDFGSDTISEYSIPKRPPTTYIVPQADKPKRTDPVARLNAYRRDWQRFSFPGQDSHQSLRWAVRRQMLQSGGSRQAQQHAVPKKHKVPTAKKKRDSLRSDKRWDLPRPDMPRRDVAF